MDLTQSLEKKFDQNNISLNNTQNDQISNSNKFDNRL